MTSKTLSAVLEKHIQQLCLNDFPCGYGSWRQNKKGEQVEETHALLDLLDCPHSPWTSKETWSPEAAALRRLAVLTPKRLDADFIYTYFTTLRIVDKDVSHIDDGLLKFSKLKELVLSANNISEILVENLPSSLKVLELRANRLSVLTRLTSSPPPHLHYLGLGSNSLGSHEDAPHLTGIHWPELVVLDLSDCEFQEQRILLEALSTLPRLRTLFLEGNPITLAPCYPGLTVDCLPHLSYLDASWISPKQRHVFQGLANISAVTADQALATVSVGRVRGIPNPLTSVNEHTSEFPVITYGYLITYEFICHQTPVNTKYDREFHFDAAATAPGSDTCSSDVDLQSNENCDKETRNLRVLTEEPCYYTTHVSTHRTAKLPWSECMDFSDTQTYTVTDLGALKKFLKQGLTVRVEEEKVMSWPAFSEEVTVADSGQTVKGNKNRKGKESSVKSGSIKDKSKDKKKKSVPELVQDPPIRRTLSSVHVSLQSLKRSGQKVEVVCDLGALHTEEEVEAKFEKDMEKKLKESKQKEDSEKNAKRSKGKGREKSKVDVLTVDSASVQLEPVTVEFSVELETWTSTSEAQLHTQ